ncbi:HIT-like protein [Neoconidiobolus thromboides FSU 785]|nr:HIT-like protein [Neoconidiobolus thromboides FSU 785]
MSCTQLIQRFQYEQLIHEDPALKKVVLLGYIQENDQKKEALLFLEKLQFELMDLKTNFSNSDKGEKEGYSIQKKDNESNNEGRNVLVSRIKDLKMVDNNDIYYWFQGNLNNNKITQASYFDIKLQLIYPATQIHINKYSYQKRIMIKETIDDYEKIVLPSINELPGKHIDWVYNILNGEKEQESIIFNDQDEDTGFVLMPDSKWDRQTMSSLYLLVIVRKKIQNLRHLSKEDLPLLKNILNTVPQIVEKKFNGEVQKNQLKLYVHYPPSYYHFHVHVTHVENISAPGMLVEQAHLLSDIIENIELMQNYYQKKSLNYSLGENHFIYKMLKQNNRI